MTTLQGTEGTADDGHPLYARMARIGQGSYGGVWLARRRADGAEVALKYIDVSDDMKMIIMREICNHLKLVHPHIVRLERVSLHAGAIVLELEALPGGDLCRAMGGHPGGMPDHIARWYFQQIVLGVDYCHAKLVCNRDLKLENVVLGAPGRGPGGAPTLPLAKLCDFGWSKDEGGDSAPHTRAGSPAYVAPEVLAGGGAAPYDGAAADAWSLGVILHCLLLGRNPFVRAEDAALRSEVAKLQALSQRILVGAYELPPAGAGLSPGARDLIERLLVVEPSGRLTVDGIMRHAWTFQGDSTERVDATLAFNSLALAREAKDPQTMRGVEERTAQADAVFAALGWERPAGL